MKTLTFLINKKIQRSSRSRNTLNETFTTGENNVRGYSYITPTNTAKGREKKEKAQH